MRQLYLLILIAIAASIWGCADHRAEATLDRAEALVETAPDSALTLLNESVDAGRLSRGSELQARYALLMTQTLDKNYIDVTDDSLISIATSYYSRHRDDLRRLMLAQYYHGRVKYNAGDHSDAIAMFHKAYEAADALGDNFWVGLSCREICRIYYETSNCAEGIYFAKLAFEDMRKTGKHGHTYSIMTKLINAYYDKSEYEQGMKLNLQLQDSLKLHPSPRYEREMHALLGKGYQLLEDYDKAIPHLKKACSMPGANARDTAYLGRAYAKLGKIDSAKVIMQQLMYDNDCVTAELKSEVYQITGDYKNAYKYLQCYVQGVNSQYEALLNNDIPHVVTNIVRDDRKSVRNELSTNRTRFSIIIVILLLAVIIGSSFGIRFYIKQRRKIARNMVIADELRVILKATEENVSDTIDKLLAKQFCDIDALIKKYYEISDKQELRKQISKAVENIIDSLSNRTDKIKTIEDQINNTRNNILSHFKSEFPSIKDADYMLFLYSILGFSSNAIVILLKEENIESVYNRKARLKTKIKRSGSPNADKYLKYL